MINFKEVKLDKRADITNLDPFVGIRKNESGEPEFRLPVGFEDFPEGDFEKTKKLFFRMYRTFKKFEDTLHKKRNKMEDTQQKQRDNIETSNNAYRFKDKEGNDVILYSKISVIENMLDVYRDLSLNIIERKIGRNENIDFSRIDCYLHKAIYLADDVIYIDEMDLPRYTLQYESANLIELFCFILYELQQELEQDVDIRVKELSEKFRLKYLNSSQSIFDEKSYEITIIQLKEILDNIDKNTTYKDDDYWQLYEAIESFLYGELDMKDTHENGIFWGINNFYQVWEDMCNTYYFINYRNDILYADTNILINNTSVSNSKYGGREIFCKETFKNPFFIEFRNQKRWMRPDLLGELYLFENHIKIIIKKHHNNNELIDFYAKPENEEGEKILRKIKKYKSNGAFCDEKNNFTGYKTAQLLSIREEYKIFFIIDWKYCSKCLFSSSNDKIRKDLIKQLAYEFALSQNHTTIIRNQIVIPVFIDNNILEYKNIFLNLEEQYLSHEVKNSGVSILKANFSKIQLTYLSQS